MLQHTSFLPEWIVDDFAVGIDLHGGSRPGCVGRPCRLALRVVAQFEIGHA